MEANDFLLVSFEKDRERAFEQLALRSALVTGWTLSGRPLYFQVQGVDATGIRLTVVDGDGLSARAGEDAEFLFSLDDGQYNWKTQIQEIAQDRWSLSRGGELFRLQRRNNFRTGVPRGFKVDVILRSFKTASISPTVVKIIDVSAGGARVEWPAGLSTPLIGDSLSGTIAVPGGRTIDVFGLVKSIVTDVDTGQMQAGLEFQNLSGRDEQTLLHLCLQIRRHVAPVLR